MCIVCGDLREINQSTVSKIIYSVDQIASCLGDHIKLPQPEAQCGVIRQNVYDITGMPCFGSFITYINCILIKIQNTGRVLVKKYFKILKDSLL